MLEIKKDFVKLLQQNCLFLHWIWEVETLKTELYFPCRQAEGMTKNSSFLADVLPMCSFIALKGKPIPNYRNELQVKENKTELKQIANVSFTILVILGFVFLRKCIKL